MTRNSKVENLLEEGRSINERDKLDSFYKEVSRTVLQEAPLAHIGFNKVVTIYRNDIVEYNEKLLRRNEGHLVLFKSK